MIIKLSVTHSFAGAKLGFHNVQNPYDIYLNSEYVVRFTRGTTEFTKIYLSDGSAFGVSNTETEIFNAINNIQDRAKVAL